MHRYLRVLSLIVLAAVALPAEAQRPDSAGAKRPKLQVLQSLPESQLYPLMNVIATSLGVRCEYCHVNETPDLTRTPMNVGGWVFDRDDKPTKRRAREMMKMVQAINATTFRGEARVTCYTCHRGTTRPLRLPPLPPPLHGYEPSMTRTPLPSVDRVLASYLAAVGGSETSARTTSMIMRGWDDRAEGRYGRFEITVAGSDRYRLSLTTPEITATQGLDGDIAWSVTKNGVQRMTSPADIARMRRLAMRYRLVKEQPPNLRVVGIERVNDRDAYVLQGKIDSVTTQMSYFDVVTGLLRREITTTETILIPLIEQVDYDDYRDVNGVQMPFRIRVSTGAPYDMTTRTVMEIRRNVPVGDTLFRPPGELNRGAPPRF